MSDIHGTFVDYQETTVDPGWSFIYGALTTFLLLNACLPCIVSLGSRYERRRNIEGPKKRSSDDTTDVSDEYGKSSAGSSQARDQVLIVGINQLLSNSRDPALPPPSMDEQSASTERNNGDKQSQDKTSRGEPDKNADDANNKNKDKSDDYVFGSFFSVANYTRGMFCGLADSVSQEDFEFM